MYRDTQIMIRPGHPLYDYCSTVCHNANNLYNAALFRQRQLMTGLKKEHPTENEQEIIDEVSHYLANREFSADKWLLSYYELNDLMKKSENPDYMNGLPRQTAQNVLRQMARDFKSFFKANKEYNRHPEKFTGKPKLPGYKTKGGQTTAAITNQECVICEDGLKLPLTKERLKLRNGVSGRLKEVKIVPYHDVYVIHVIMDTEEEPGSCREPARIIAIDRGVSNLAAITNNCGLPCLLFKGGSLKSVNQWYNKQIARIMSEQTTGTTNKFRTTPEYQKLCVKRENRMRDAFHKTAKHIVDWCIDNDIDTIVVGVNKGWKQESNMGKTSNQNFVQLPFDKLCHCLMYRCMKAGINYIEQEESYTSRASFLSKDYMPIYGKDDDKEENLQFSGYRMSRGLYKDKCSSAAINADLNGSANILRKAFPDMDFEVNFKDIQVIKNSHVVPRS